MTRPRRFPFTEDQVEVFVPPNPRNVLFPETYKENLTNGILVPDSRIGFSKEVGIWELITITSSISIF